MKWNKKKQAYCTATPCILRLNYRRTESAPDIDMRRKKKKANKSPTPCLLRTERREKQCDDEPTVQIELKRDRMYVITNKQA